MFVRMVSGPMKAGTSSKYAEVTENQVIPLIRSQKGFVDQIALVSTDGKHLYGISFWDRKESAEAYDRSTFGEVKKALDTVLAGPLEVQTCDVTNSTIQKIAPARVS